MTVTDGADVEHMRRVAAGCLVPRTDRLRAGGEAIAGLLAAGESFRDIERETGVPKATAGRWLAKYREHVKAQTNSGEGEQG